MQWQKYEMSYTPGYSLMYHSWNKRPGPMLHPHNRVLCIFFFSFLIFLRASFFYYS